MSDNKNSFDYNLETPINYAFKGEQVEGGYITLFPPTSKNIKECCELKQAFFRALPKTQDTTQASEQASDKDQEITGEAIMGLISMSPDVELSSVLLIARELFCSKDVALVDGETKLTKPILDGMSPDELETMAGEYMATFIVASALKKMKKV